MVLFILEINMARSIPHSFYTSKQWIQTQKSYMERASGLCEECLLLGRLSSAKIVHHRIHLNLDNYQDPKIAYGFDNLEAVCIDCHNRIHELAAKKSKKRYRYVNGELIINDD